MELALDRPARLLQLPGGADKLHRWAQPLPNPLKRNIPMDARSQEPNGASPRRGNSALGLRLIAADEWPAIGERLGLTNRELEVVRLSFQGMTREEAARRLQISAGTVRQYLQRIHEKLEVPDRVQLVLRVIECRDHLREETRRPPR